MITNISPGSTFLFTAQRAAYRPHLLCYVHPALAGSMFLDVFSPAHFFNAAPALCAPFSCSGHRSRHLKEGSYLCAALSTMTSALTDLTSTSAALAPFTSSRGSLISSLSSLWAWLFPADGITRIAPHITGFSPGQGRSCPFSSTSVVGQLTRAITILFLTGMTDVYTQDEQQ